MLVQELFRRATVERGAVLQDVIDILAPTILHRYGAQPALGGSDEVDETRQIPEGAKAYTQKQRQGFSKLGDQSLATHLINGLFIGFRLMEHLPDNKVLDEQMQRIWALGYAAHDYTKERQLQVSAGDLALIREIVSSIGNEHGWSAFMPDWSDYLDDIVYIAQNTQFYEGSNLNFRDYSCRSKERDLRDPRVLSSIVDIIVHITSPSDVHFRDYRGKDIAYNLRVKFTELFGAEQAPRLAYHKLLEVRGLLSNVVNNALIKMLKEQSYEPFLFFPEGVIYLAPKQSSAQVDLDMLTSEVWNRIVRILTGGKGGDEATGADDDDEAGGGLRIRRTKDYLKVPPVLYEVLSLSALLEAGRRTALAVRNSRAVLRFGAEQADEQQIRVTGLSQNQKNEIYLTLGQPWAAEQHLPFDVRVDRLAEYLGFIRRRMFVELFPKLQSTTTLLLDALGLADEITPERAERQRSGTPTGWFYVAARYLQEHPGMDEYELERVMKHLAERALAYLAEQGVSRPDETSSARAIADYVRHMIEVDGRVLCLETMPVRDYFTNELQRYMRSRDDNKVLCSLCAGAYEAALQDVSVVLFKPQQYSNKSALDRSRVVRGICPICAVEMMLRQVQQGAPNGEAQEYKPINIYLYPTYFFTMETATVVRSYVALLQNLVLKTLIFTHMETQGFSYESLLNYEQFLVEEDEDRPVNSMWKPHYSEDDLAALFFITFRPLVEKKKLTETDAWIIPTFFALALPLLLGVKCVATPSFTTLYNSAIDFKETVRLDGPHEYTKYVLNDVSFRIDQIPEQLFRLLRLYSVHLDVFSDLKSNHWSLLTSVAKDIATDPLNVFSYYERRQRSGREDAGGAKGKRAASTERGSGITLRDQQRYMGVYETLGGTKKMGVIGDVVDAYAKFYRSSNLGSAYSVLRPLNAAMDVVVDSDPRTDIEDLVLLVAGAVNDDQDRVRSGQAEGFDPVITNKAHGDYVSRLNVSRGFIEDFAQVFIQRCFKEYCKEDRAILRERTNRIRSAARFYYLTHFARREGASTSQTETLQSSQE